MSVINNLFDADVIIVGGGISGSTLASLLARQNIKCLILEERPGQNTLERDDPRTLAITRASENILRAANAWQLIPRDRIGLFRSMFVWEETGKGDIEFNSADLCESTLGYIIEQNVLECVLAKANTELPCITRIQPASVKLINLLQDRVCVELTDGKQLSAKLLVAADGAKSTIRGMAGITYPVHDYHQQAVACIVETEKEHGSVARQIFLASGPLAFLPMANPHYCGVVWSTSPAHASRLLAMNTETFNDSLAEAFSFTLGRVISSKQRTGFPLQHAQAERYCLPRFALLGDAAHTVHPLAGQGANLGLLDAATLAEVILDAANYRKDIGAYSVLRRYERWRRGENHLMLKVIQGFKLLFESRLTSVRYIRNIGLDLVDMVSPVKNMIMRHASGLSGDLPRFARN